MMFAKSIRWRLQIWYGLILVIVLVGFGFTAFQLERGRQFRRIDDELQRRAGVLLNMLRPPRPQFPPDRLREQRQRDERPVEPRSEDNAPDRQPMPWDFRLPQLRDGLFDESDTNGFYYIVRSIVGKELARSANAPAEPVSFSGPWIIFAKGPTTINANAPPGDVNAPLENTPPLRGPQRQPPQTHGHFRELMQMGPAGVNIFVGRSIAPELKELNRTALGLAGVGGGILLLGFVGGWWIVTRAMRPIGDISTTAVKISAGDLAQRINVAETDSELGQLAGVLNSTFARLETSFAQQQQFTSDAAHELRTPVSVMLTQTQTALNRERSAAEYRETVEACQRAAQRMRRLTEALLELARLDAGQEQMKRMQFDLSRIAGDCVEMVRPLADERGVKILCELPPLNCVGDPERLAQVITNLLTNAVNYNKDNGEIRVSARQQIGAAVLTVTDTGQGISAEDLPRVFERFYRADKSRSSGHTGLGLAICKAIVEAHGGTIEVASQPGTGTTFTVRLPI